MSFANGKSFILDCCYTLRSIQSRVPVPYPHFCNFTVGRQLFSNCRCLALFSVCLMTDVVLALQQKFILCSCNNICLTSVFMYVYISMTLEFFHLIIISLMCI